MRRQPNRTGYQRWVQGFTVLELMIALSIAGLLIVMTYQAYKGQQHTYLVQQQVVEMQQNLRAASWLITRELRMAGYDGSNGIPTKDSSCNIGGSGSAVEPGILATTPTRLDFSMDLNGNGDCKDENENITYQLRMLTDNNSATGFSKQLARKDNTRPVPSFQVIASHFNVLDLVYRDAVGNQPTNPEMVRSVKLSLLAYGGKGDPKKRSAPETYTFSGGTSFPTYQYPRPGITYKPGDELSKEDSTNMHRRRLTTFIRCRNMGL